MNSIFDAIKNYRKENLEDSSNQDPWEIFWDHKIDIERKGGELFDDDNLNLTAMHLFIYLCCFGMGRSSTNLTYSNIKQFTEIFSNTGESIKTLSSINFSNLREEDGEVVMECFDNLRKELKKKGISDTDTMVTKILMACWGETLAYDTRFYKAYTSKIGRCKSGKADYFSRLLKIKEKYDNSWKKEIDRLPERYRLTEKGNLIPPARLIDMAFWAIGDELITEKSK